MKLNFDVAGQVETPTLVLARRNGTKIGQLTNLSEIKITGSMTAPKMSFKINKYNGNKITPYWDNIKDFKLIWCKDTDIWFEIKVNEAYSDDVTKSVELIRLGNAELRQTIIRNMEINTEADILRDDYVQPTLFYNELHPEASLLHRLLDKTPHYTIEYIDHHLKNIQRVFSFNGKTVEECFEEIAKELDVLFVYNSNSDENGSPKRTISVYDLKSYCPDCGARGNFVNTCLNCGSNNVLSGYGKDTTICVSKEDLGNEITITVNQDEVKNCFYLEAGDDLMTATIRNCNPNGTSYIWNPGTNIEDMDTELQELLTKYSADYDYYRDQYVSSTSYLPVSNYNSLVNKYKDASEEIHPITLGNTLIGYSPIMQHYYDAVDLEVFLYSGLLPSLVLQETTAVDEAAKLTVEKLSPVAVVDKKYMTLANASTAVLNAAKIAADPRYKIVVKQSSLSGNTWTGNFTVTNFSDERDSWDSDVIKVIVNDDYETYVKQKLRKSLYNGTKGKYGSVAQMIDMSDADFQAQLKKYSLIALNSINTCFTECLNILSEQEIDKEEAELYSTVYTPIQSKIGYIQAEVVIREHEVKIMQNMQSGLLSLKKFINDKLNLENYLGTSLWLDFCSYRREGTFSNENYISDYLTNAQLFERANEFMDLAQYEISKVSIYTHTIDSTLKNLLVIPEFKPLVDYFECGNWIRIKDDDGVIYKLRLLDYEISFDNLENIEVTFSDITRKIDKLAPVKEILINSSNIINNYNAAMNKTNSNFESINDSMKDVISDTGFNNGYISDSYHDVKDDLKQTEKQIYSDIDVTNTSIRTYVGDVERSLYSEITQTATEIRAEVKDADDGLSSRITQNANQITAEVTARQNADNQLSSKITQTASEIKAEVAETYETIDVVQSKYDFAVLTSKTYTDAQIKATSDNINLSVDAKVKTTIDTFNTTLGSYSTTAQMNAAIDVKANQITNTVSETYYTKSAAGSAISSLQSQITQNANGISSKVSRGDVISEINQSADGVRINANKIEISGETTINGNFYIDDSGNLIIGNEKMYARLIEQNLRVVYENPSGQYSTTIGQGAVTIKDPWGSAVVAYMLNGASYLQCDYLNGDIPITSADLSGYAKTGHSHSGVYAPYSHSHGEYLTSSDLSGYSKTGHSHSEYSKTDHYHSGYATLQDMTDMATDLRSLSSTVSSLSSMMDITSSNIGGLGARIRVLEEQVAALQN